MEVGLLLLFPTGDCIQSTLWIYLPGEKSPDLGRFSLQNPTLLGGICTYAQHADAHKMAQNDMMYRSPFWLEMLQQQQQ